LILILLLMLVMKAILAVMTPITLQIDCFSPPPPSQDWKLTPRLIEDILMSWKLNRSRFKTKRKGTLISYHSVIMPDYLSEVPTPNTH